MSSVIKTCSLLLFYTGRITVGIEWVYLLVSSLHCYYYGVNVSLADLIEKKKMRILNCT